MLEGNVLAGGADTPVGTVISAYIDSKLVGWNSITEAEKYKLAVSGTEQDNGKKIIFKLGSIESEPVSVIYQQGALPAKLDLSFKGDFVDPVIESPSASPVYILNDGKDFSVISARVSDESSGVASVTYRPLACRKRGDFIEAREWRHLQLQRQQYSGWGVQLPPHSYGFLWK